MLLPLFFSCSVVSDSLQLHGLQHARLLRPSLSLSLLRLMSIESVMPSNHLILSCHLLLLPSIFLSIMVFSSESSSHQVAKVLQLQLHHQSFQWIFRIDFLYDGLVWSPCCQRDSQESSLLPEFKSINSSALSLLYGSTLISKHDYWKTIALTIWPLLAKWCLCLLKHCLGLT